MKSMELDKKTIEAAMALCTLKGTNQIQEPVDNNTDKAIEESTNGIMNMLLDPARVFGGWFGWMLRISNHPVDIFSAAGLRDVLENLLSHLDGKTLATAELVCKKWYKIIRNEMLWKKLIERNVKTDSNWRKLAEEEGWIQYLFNLSPEITHPDHTFYRNLFFKVSNDIKNMNKIWFNRTYKLRRIINRNSELQGIYCMQYDNQKIIAGSRDHSIKFWDPNTLICTKVLTGHEGSVLCLQFDDKVIISGSSDSTVRVWDVASGKLLNTLTHHADSVLSLKFYNDVLVTSGKDRSVVVWDMKSPTDIQLRHVLVGHRASVNAVDFDEKYIVSASADRTIKVWNTSTCEFVRSISGHKSGIACLQYQDRLVVSGSSDNTIRLWDIENAACLRTLEGHEELVRCIRFDSSYIVSGDCKGEIKVWDLKGALDLERNDENLCLRTFKDHIGRVSRLQFNDCQIVSASRDNTILIREFPKDKKDTNVLQNNFTESNSQIDETFSSLTNEDVDDFVIID